MLAFVRYGIGAGLMPQNVLASFNPETSLACAQIQGNRHQRDYVLSYIEGHTQMETLEDLVNALTETNQQYGADAGVRVFVFCESSDESLGLSDQPSG